MFTMIFKALLLLLFYSGIQIGAGLLSSEKLVERVQYNRHDVRLQNSTIRNFCYCSYGPTICEFDEICLKHENAACFHAVQQVYKNDDEFEENEGAEESENSEESEGLGAMHTIHYFGCAALERGTNASHLMCNAWRLTHSNPSSIACCYEGNFCNANIPSPSFTVQESKNNTSISDEIHTKYQIAFGILGAGCLVGILLFLCAYCFYRCFFFKREKLPKWAQKVEALRKPSLISAESSLLCPKNESANIAQSGDFTSGSGSGQVALNQRTIALDLIMLEMVARGRYGEVRKALYRESYVAVKIFYTTEEESWKNERDIYQTQMLNHENILQYVAADISSSVDSITQMMLITDFHPCGSLYDYLRNGELLSLEEALHLAFSTIAGIEHLHNAVRGTGSRKKPEIAHRDVKSKNVIVKRRGVCCIADFGLAVRCENKQIIPEKINIQVGTRRYMAPELLAKTLNITNFDEFKCADIYSYALVLWEICQRVQIQNSNGEQNGNNKIFGQQNLPQQQQQYGNVGSRSLSSGIATGGSTGDRCATFDPILNRTHCQQQIQNYTPPNKMRPPPINNIARTTSEANSSSFSSMGSGAVVRLLLPYTPTNTRLNETANGNLENENVIMNSATITEGVSNSGHAYTLPYHGLVDHDPTFEQMRRVVCEQHLRPSINPEWQNPKNMVMKSLCDLMCECWSENAKSRHTSLKVKKEINALISSKNSSTLQ